MNDGAILITKASTDVTLQIKLYDATNGSVKTGVTITDLDLYYIRVEDDEDVTLSNKIDLTALSALTDAHTANKAYEIGYGYYRIDLPDAVFTTGVTTGSIIIVDGTSDTILQATIDFQLVDFNPYDLKTEINTEVASALATYDPPTRTELTADKEEIIRDCLNENIIKEPNFIPDSGVWVDGTSWGIDSDEGFASKIGAGDTAARTITQNLEEFLLRGHLYKLTYTVTDIAGGCTITPTLCTDDGTTRSTNGTFTDYLTPSNDEVNTMKLSFLASSDGTMLLKSVEVIKATALEALNFYDPPTRTEATADKAAIITEVDANETKIDAIKAETVLIVEDTGTTLPAQITEEASAPKLED